MARLDERHRVEDSGFVETGEQQPSPDAYGVS